MTGPLTGRAPDRRLKRVVAAITVGALTLLVGLRAVDLWWWRRQLLDGGRLRAENQTRILAEYVRGAVVDFSDSLTGGGFKISNPNARQSCGCGKSFTS